ncbi:MAG: hypothetical protein ABIG61_03150 [Planctomycetota bacterium]
MWGELVAYAIRPKILYQISKWSVLKNMRTCCEITESGCKFAIFFLIIGILLPAYGVVYADERMGIENDTISVFFDKKTGGIQSGYAKCKNEKMEILGGGIVFYDHAGKEIKPIENKIAQSNGNITQYTKYSFGENVTVISKRGKALNFHWNARNHTNQQLLARINFEVHILLDGKRFYNGYETLDLTNGNSYKRWDGLVDRLQRIPLNCIYDDNVGVGMSISAEEFYSDWVPESRKNKDDTVIVAETMRIVLDPNGSYDGTFVLFGFSSKYQERAAVACWQSLYPNVFERKRNVDQRVYGISASYLSWSHNDVEKSRLFGADWEWCINPYRRNGDIADSERFWDYEPVRPMPQKFQMSRQAWLQKQRMLLARAKMSNVANCYYIASGVWAESQLASHFPDAIITNEQSAGGVYRICWGPEQDDSQAMFSYETSYGDFLRESLKNIAQRQDISAIAFDSPNSQLTYRGPVLKKIKHKSWDEKGPYVSNAVAVSKLLDFIPILKSANGKQMATITNINSFQHFLIAFHTDSCMIEGNPWREEPPFPIQYRYIMGQKGMTFWEGYGIGELIDLSKASDEQITQAYRGMADYVALRSIYVGVPYQHYFSNGIEYLVRLLPLVKELNNAIWQPILAFQSDNKKLWLSRYGQKYCSYLAIGNPTENSFAGKLTAFSDELGLPAGAVFAEYFGCETTNEIFSNETKVAYDIPSRKPRVFRSVMTLNNVLSAKVIASEHRDFGSITLNAKVTCSQGDPINVTLPIERGDYRLTAIIQDGARISFEEKSETATFDFSPSQQDALVITYDSVKTKLTEQQILANDALDEFLGPRLKIVTGKNEGDEFLGRRLKEFYRNYITVKKCDKSKAASCAVDIEISPSDRLPRNNVCLLFGESSLSLIRARMLDALPNRPWLTGIPGEGFLLFKGGDYEQLQEILYDYMNLLSRTKYADWFGSVYLNSSYYKLPMSKKERELFGEYYQIAFSRTKPEEISENNANIKKSTDVEPYRDAARVIIQPANTPNKNLFDSKAWVFNTAFPDKFETRRDADIFYSDGPSLQIKAKNSKASGYWRQIVDVVSGRTYLVHTWVKNKDGRILVRISGDYDRGSFDDRIYLLQGKPNFLEPVFLKSVDNKQTDKDEWVILAKAVKIPQGLNKLMVDFGSYFNTGEIWFDGMSIVEGLEPVELIVNSKKKLSSMTLYMQSTGDMVFSKRFEGEVYSYKTVVPDTTADQSYSLAITFVDGSRIREKYPCESQIFKR